MTDPVQARKELADQSKALLDDPAFQAAILKLRQQWFADLMASDRPDHVAGVLGKLRALEAIPQQLQVFINDQSMYKRKSG